MRVVSPKNNKECVCVCSGRERVRITKSDTEREREKKIINEGIGTISDMDNTTGRNSNFEEEKKKTIFHLKTTCAIFINLCRPLSRTGAGTRTIGSMQRRLFREQGAAFSYL